MIRFLLFLALTLVPLYTFASGGLQASHAVFLLLAAVILVRQRIQLQSIEIAMIALIILVATRETIATFQGFGDSRSILEVFYVIFPLIVLMGISRLPNDFRVDKSLVHGLILGMIVAIGSIILLGASFVIEDGEISRSVGTFNNPNQLAYYGVSTLGIGSVLYLRSTISRSLYLLVVIGSLFLVGASLSKAGMVGAIVAATFSMLILNNQKRLSIGTWMLASALVLMAYAAFSMGAFDGFSFVQRLQNIGSDSDDSFAARGYWIASQVGGPSVIFGLGEQQVRMLVGHEVHSTIFSFLAKFGVLGALLIGAVLSLWTVRVFREFRLIGVVLIVLPPMLYGVGHNGSRFTIFWVLVALSCRVTSTTNQSRVDPRGTGIPEGILMGSEGGRWRA